MRQVIAFVCFGLAVAGCAGDARLATPRAGARAPETGGVGETGGAGAAGTNHAGAPAAGAAGTSGTSSLPALDAESIFASSCYRDPEPKELIPATILFVIDRSGSMACNPPPVTDSATCERDAKRATPDPSKWEITKNALLESLKILPEASRVGVSYFSNDDACGVQGSPIVPLNRNSSSQKDLIRASLSTVTPGGSTPLVGATILAYQYMYDFVRAGLVRGNSFVVLITDGKQSEMCGDRGRCTTAEECTTLLIKEEVPRAAASGVAIRTFVIGVPGSELDRRTLSRIAVAGMTPRANCDPERDCHFDVSGGGDFSANLRQALQNIVGQTFSCDLPAPPAEHGDLDKVNVIYKPMNLDRMLVRQDKSRPCDSGANGWQYTANNTRIRLCGEICNQVKSDPGGQLAVVIGCPVQGPE